MEASSAQDMQEIIARLDSIRADLVRGQENHITELRRKGFTALDALKDWQDNLSRILLSLEETVRQLRARQLGLSEHS